LCIDNCLIVRKDDSKIPRKKRFYQDQFPLCRLDVESKNYNIDNLDFYQNEICNNLKKHNFDVAIFSDYNKGVFNDCNIKNYYDSLDSKTIKIVDPKYGPINKWFGCDLIKPNSKEAKQITGKSNWKDQARFIQQETAAKYVLITQGGEGVVGIKDDDYFEYYPDYKVQLNSVIGAGDCFISVMALCLSNNFDFFDSIRISFLAGSIYVKNKYNKPIHPLDLCESKIVDSILFKKRNFTVCFTNGCFDFGLTSGHIECLKFAKLKADKLIVGLNSDNSVSRLKGSSRPILPFEERAKILSSLEFVDYIIGFEEDTPINLINSISPDLIVKGGDYKKEEVVGHESFPVEIFNLINCVSTTDKINKINNI
jgi:D-beta-D-heptose 7-phosphate kinase/D-beta-D-heptose 1-phosphate adenosyltransferase